MGTHERWQSIRHRRRCRRCRGPGGHLAARSGRPFCALQSPRQPPYISASRDPEFAHDIAPAAPAVALGPCRHCRPCRDPGGRLRPGAAGPVLHRRGQAVLCRGGPEGGPGGRQRLCRAHRHDPEPAVRGPVLPPLLRCPRDARAERAAAALARFRRAGRPGRPGGHQPSRDRRRRPGEGLAGRPARVRGRDRPQGRPLRSRGAADQGQRRAVPGARIRRFRRAPGRRPGAGDRQSLRASARP